METPKLTIFVDNSCFPLTNTLFLCDRTLVCQTSEKITSASLTISSQYKSHYTYFWNTIFSGKNIDDSR